jgi:hypothetical protein
MLRFCSSQRLACTVLFIGIGWDDECTELNFFFQSVYMQLHFSRDLVIQAMRMENTAGIPPPHFSVVLCNIQVFD